LNVDGVLEGQIQRANGRIRVTLRLIRTSDGLQLWSGLINDSESELFRLQDSLAQLAAQALSVNLRPRRDVQPPTGDLEAYRLYLKGDYLFRLRGNENNTLSLDFFRQATERDPNFARAWAGLAAALAMGTDIPAAEKAINTAIELDPDLAEAHATRGFIDMFHYWNWDEAERSLNRAVELDPNSLQAHHWRGVLYSIRGRFDEAKSEMFRALELDPVSLNITSDLGQLFYFAGDLELGEQFCLKALAIDPAYGFAHGYLHQIYEARLESQKAFEHLARGSCAAYSNEKSRLNCMENFEKLRNKGGLRAFYDTGKQHYLEELAGRRPMSASRSNAFYGLAQIAIRNGNEKEAIDHLNRSLESKADYEIMNFTLAYVAVNPEFRRLRSQPSFIRFLERMKLAPA
jgi:Flp pilus assembly protein TadD